MNSQIKSILVSLLVSLLMMTLLGKMTFILKGIEFETSLEISNRGMTEIDIPPVGSISAHTHYTPLKILVELRNIDIDILQQLLKEAPSSTILMMQIKDELQKNIRQYLFRLLLLAVLGGLTGSILVSGKQLKTAVIGALAGFCFAVFLLGMTYYTFNPEKLRNPEYHGALKSAPWALELAETAFHKFNVLSEQIQVIAANICNMFERIEMIEPVKEEKGDLLVLHISDIHNNPVAHKILMEIVDSFPVDFVIDTGDLTDYGTPLESMLLTSLKDIKVPYLFVPGNHDSPDTIKEMAQYPEVKLLTGGIVDVQGLRILALADPSSSSHAIAPSDNAVVDEYKKRLYSMWAEAEEKPQIVAIHNINLAEQFIGKVPIILYGHNHQYSILEEKGTVLIDAGTTGAAGIRGLQAIKEVPYSVVLLHFKRDEKNNLSLIATDTIKIYSLEKGFILERQEFKK